MSNIDQIPESFHHLKVSLLDAIVMGDYVELFFFLSVKCVVCPHMLACIYFMSTKVVYLYPAC